MPQGSGGPVVDAASPNRNSRGAGLGLVVPSASSLRHCNSG